MFELFAFRNVFAKDANQIFLDIFRFDLFEFFNN